MLYSLAKRSPMSDVQKEAVEYSSKKVDTYFSIKYDKSGNEIVPVIELESFVVDCNNRIQINIFPKMEFKQSYLVARYEAILGKGRLYITSMNAAILKQRHGRALFETLVDAVEVLNGLLSERDYGQPYPKIESIQGEISPDELKISRKDLITFYKEMGCTISGPVNNEQLYYQL
nr:hypothetical protein [Paenibacillus xylanexedens]